MSRALNLLKLLSGGGSTLVGNKSPATGAVDESVSAALNRFYSVAAVGALGGGTVNETAKIQGLMDFVSAIGGGTIHFPAGTYRVRNLWARDKVRLVGVMGATIIKLIDGQDGQILGNQNQATGDSIDYFEVEGIIFDGNKDAIPRTSAQSAVAINILTHFRARDCIFQNATGYGFGAQAYPAGTLHGDQSDLYFENCQFLNNGIGSVSGGDTYDGVDIKESNRCTFINCRAAGNADKGFNLRGKDINFIGCTTFGNGIAGFEATASAGTEPCSVSLVNCSADSDAGSGYAFSDGSATPEADAITRVTMTNCRAGGCIYGVQLPNNSTQVELVMQGCQIWNSSSHGIRIASPTRSVIISNTTIKDNTGSGIFNNSARTQIDTCEIIGNGAYGIQSGPSADRTIVAGATKVLSNASGAFLWIAGGRRYVASTVADYDVQGGDIIASAATITLPEGGETFFITGTTSITSITAGRRGRKVTLVFSGVLTLTDGGNLLLASNFVTTSNDAIDLVCDGTNWIQTGPGSVN